MRQFRIFYIVLFSLLSIPSVFSSENTETAIFAGGCFWSMQHDFEKINGIVSTTVGYTGGEIANPSYEQVSTGNTGHYEAIKIVYRPDQISYDKLLDYYWHDTDPTNGSGQFCDSGSEYRPAIFYLNPSQEKIAKLSKSLLEGSKKFDIVQTKIMPAKAFYPAENYHQHYSDKNPAAYNAYRLGCERDITLKQVWQFDWTLAIF